MDELLCSKCGQIAAFKCERCFEPYCSSQCQVNDWQDHKSKCYKFPNLLPINILKSVASNLHLERIGSSQRRQYGSTHNLGESRRANTPVNGSKIKPRKLLSDDDFNMVPKAASASAVSTLKTFSESSCTWRIAFPPSEGFFDAVVQFKEEIDDGKRIIWVTDLKYVAPLHKLLAEINRAINPKSPCNFDEIYEGALVAATLDKMLYRAEVLEICPDVQKASVRLIDYGNELKVSYSQLFSAIPVMCNLNAYAFRVCLPNDYDPIEIHSIVTIRILGEKQIENYYSVECKMKSIPLHLPIELLSNRPALEFVKCFTDGRNALLQLSSSDVCVNDEEFDNFLNSEQGLNFEFESLPQVGAFLAARTIRGWKRARLLGFCEKQNTFLIYAVDEGFICFSSQIKKIPESFIIQPMRVFAVSTKSADSMLSEAMLTTAKGLTLQLLPTSTATIKDSKTKLFCALYDEQRQIMDAVMASVFTGSINELGIKLWNESVPEGDTVIVSHVLTYKEIYIASQQNSEYSKILMSEYNKCVPIAIDETIDKHDIVMYRNKVNGEEVSQCCRGQVVKCENALFKVMDVDSGSERMIARHDLLKPTPFIRSLPVRCVRVTLMYLASIPTPVANNKALEALETCMQNAVEFNVTFGENGCVDLLFRTKEKQSLCKKLLPMVFEPVTKQTPIPAISENKLNLLSPPNTPIPNPPSTNSSIQGTVEPDGATNAEENKIFTIDDLEVIPITCGEKIPLYVLDSSTIVKGDRPYVTAACYNKEFAAEMDNNLKAVGDYCKSDLVPRNGYSPKKLEICLCIFADDGEWYRALCLDQKPNDTFVVMFLDYGNLSKVNKKDIIPMTPDLMYPSNANMVFIEGITSKEQGIAFAKSVQKNPIIYANVRKLSEDAYAAKICM